MTENSNTGSSGRRLRPYISLLIAFLIGLIPMWIIVHARTAERDKAEADRGVLRMQNRIAGSAMYAKRGQYEKARQLASAFFTDVRNSLDSRTLTDEQRQRLTPILQERDDIVTLIARSDPAAVDRLFSIEYQVRQAFGDS